MSASDAQDQETGFAIARTLAEALPFIQTYDRKTIVIKYGGHAMGEEALAASFAQDVVLLKHLGVNPVVVHGGGPQIGRMLDRLAIQSRFEDGLRVTDAPTMEVVEMVLAGSINKQIVRAITAAGGKAVGLSGADAGLLRARKTTRRARDPDSHVERVLDLGFVGEPHAVDPTILHALLHAPEDFIPVVAPVAADASGQSYNINADTAAGALAGALGAARFMLLTDVAGVLDADRRLIRDLLRADAQKLIETKVATGGMIPKLETAIAALDQGVQGVVILDGRKPHALLVELFTTYGAGTLIH